MTKFPNKKQQAIARNQDGLVSIIIVVILMIVISIIVLSFAKVVRNEQRQTLDRQLSTQAYYAAESGVNYAKKVIKDRASTTPLNALTKNDCLGGNVNYDPTVSLDSGVSVSCLLVTANPKSLVYDLDTGLQSKVFPIKPETAITKVVLEWTPQTGNINNCPNQSSSPNAGVLPPAGSWTCPYGALRVDLTNTSTGLNRTALAQNTFSGVLMPTRTAGSGNVAFNGKNAFGGNSASQGTRSAAICSSTSCRMEIQFSGANANEYYMRLSTLYVNTQVTISAVNGTTPVSLKDAQILIDSTGKAQDILRRIQVRIPLVNDGIHADYGLQSKESICKAFTAYRPDDPNYSNNSSCP